VPSSDIRTLGRASLDQVHHRDGGGEPHRVTDLSSSLPHAPVSVMTRDRVTDLHLDGCQHTLSIGGDRVAPSHEPVDRRPVFDDHEAQTRIPTGPGH